MSSEDMENIDAIKICLWNDLLGEDVTSRSDEIFGVLRQGLRVDSFYPR